MSGDCDVAHKIVQDVLDGISPRVISGPREDYEQYYCLPYRRTFLNREVVVETRDEMQRDLGEFGRTLRALGANQVICVASDAEWIAPNYIASSYTVHVLRGGQSVLPSYPCRGVFTRGADGAWRLVEVHQNVHVTGYPIDFLRVPVTPPPLPSLPDDDARRLGKSAGLLYRQFIERSDAALAAEDFDAYVDTVALPFTFYGSTINVAAQRGEDLRPIFDVLKRLLNGEVGDAFTHEIEHVEFIGPGLICGYHSTTASLRGQESLASMRSRMLLTRAGEIWRLRSIATTINNQSYPFDQIEPGGTLRTELQIEAPLDSS